MALTFDFFRMFGARALARALAELSRERDVCPVCAPLPQVRRGHLPFSGMFCGRSRHVHP
eukprot:4115495-Pyramimonas_sp.AAC.1